MSDRSWRGVGGGSWLLSAAAVLLASASSGCGLIDQLGDLKNIKFDLPKQMYSVNTMDPRWKEPPPTGIPDVQCGPPPGGVIMDCCMPQGQMIDCARYPLTCEASKCTLKFPYEQVQTIDLARTVPQLKTAGQIFSRVTLTELELGITNDLNVSLPAVDLFVGPAAAMSGTHAMAKKIASIPSKPAGYRGIETYKIEVEAQNAFSNYARDVQTPFNLIMSTTMVVPSGTQVPKGKVDLVVGGKGEAGL